MPLTTLFLDMDAFFASVEQQLCPQLRARPVVVVPVQADTTCCIAASYEAKRFGIKTGTQIGQARTMCPQLRVVEARPEIYITIHLRIIEAVESCLPVAAICSIDEMYCRLMGTERASARAVQLARQIKQAISTGLGSQIRCSIGIAPNRFLAKVAAGMRKPDGLVVIEEHQLPEKLFALELSDLPGIGRQMLARLNTQGISSVQQLCALSKDQLSDIWKSVVGQEWWHWLRGDDLAEPLIHRRSVGHSHVLPPESRSDEAARAVLVRLVHKAAIRLRHIDYWARHLHVSVTYLDHSHWQDRASLGYCQDTTTMLETFAALWDRRLRHARPLKVGVTLTQLVKNNCAPIPMFSAERRRLRLAQTMDTANARFGRNAVYFGGMQTARNSAPTRIAFTSIPDINLPA